MGSPRFVLEGASVSKEKKDDKNQNIILNFREKSL